MWRPDNMVNAMLRRFLTSQPSISCGTPSAVLFCLFLGLVTPLSAQDAPSFDEAPESEEYLRLPPPPEPALIEGNREAGADQPPRRPLPASRQQHSRATFVRESQDEYGVMKVEFPDEEWTMTITPSTSVSGLSAQYREVYNSIPYRRSEYLASPSYRHDATMEFLFGEMRPTVIHRQDTPQRVENPRPQFYQPYPFSRGEIESLWFQTWAGYGAYPWMWP